MTRLIKFIWIFQEIPFNLILAYQNLQDLNESMRSPVPSLCPEDSWQQTFWHRRNVLKHSSTHSHQLVRGRLTGRKLQILREFSVWPAGGSDDAIRVTEVWSWFDTGKVKARSAVKQSVFWCGSDRWSWSLAGVVGIFHVVCRFLFRAAEMRSGTLLARGPLLLEDVVDIIHFAQLLEEGDEVQQLGVGHVVEPRGHRNLDRNTDYQQSHCPLPSIGGIFLQDF